MSCSCKKMKYKGDFNPQSVLDPESYEWHPLDAGMKTRLDKQKYISPFREQCGVAYPPSAAYPTPTSNAGESQSGTQELVEQDTERDEDGEESEEEDDDMDQHVSIFDTEMPGILTKQAVQNQVNLDNIKIQIFGANYVTSDLVSWEEDGNDDPKSLKSLFTGFAAAVGVEVISEATVHLG